jgi:hypothetical protein
MIAYNSIYNNSINYDDVNYNWLIKGKYPIYRKKILTIILVKVPQLKFFSWDSDYVKGLPFTMIIKNWFGSIPQWKIKLVFVVFIIMNLLDHISLILKFDIKFRALSLKSFHIIKSNH